MEPTKLVPLSRAIQVVHIQGRLGGAEPEPARHRAIELTLNWIEHVQGVALSDEARRGASYRPEAYATHTIEILSSETSWAARLEISDAEVAQRRWITEVIYEGATNSHGEPVTEAQIRVTCATTEQRLSIQTAVPKVARWIARDPGLMLTGEWAPASPKARHFDTDDLDDLYELLVDTGRRRDLIVAAPPTDAAERGYNLQPLARRSCGMAHPITLTSAAARSLIEMLGSAWRVPPGGVRTYHPGFDLDDEPFDHPWATAQRIQEWADAHGEPILEHLARQSAMVTLRHTPRHEIRRVSSIRAETAARAAAHAEAEDHASALADRNASLMSELEALREEYNQMLQIAEDDAEARRLAEHERDEARRELYQLRSRVQLLERDQQANGGELDWWAIECPETLEAIDEWASQHLAGRVHIENRALRETRRSPYREPQRLYRALLLLAHPYYDMRMGRGERHQFEQALNEVDVDHERSITRSQAGRYSRRYFVRRHGQDLLLDEHLKKGTGNNDAETLRIYYLWDDDDQVVVVGWMPSHLPNQYS